MALWYFGTRMVSSMYICVSEFAIKSMIDRSTIILLRFTGQYSIDHGATSSHMLATFGGCNLVKSID